MSEAEQKVDTGKAVTGIKKSRQRSPNYPSISLDKAIDKVKTLYDTFRMTWIPERTAHEAWGNAPFGSQGLLSTAALKAYGLIVFEGTGKDRKVMVTDHARRILLDADNKEDLIRESALLPPLHKELWTHYQGFMPKSDDTLRKYLLLDRHFNDQAVGGFIAQFRSTIAFANPQTGVILTPDEEVEGDKPDGRPSGAPPNQDPTKPNRPNPPAPKAPVKGEGMRELKFLLPSGEAILWLPIQMASTDFAILNTYMEAFKLASEAFKTPPPDKDGNSEDV